MPDAAVLSIRNASKSFGARRALDWLDGMARTLADACDRPLTPLGLRDIPTVPFPAPGPG